MNPRLLLWGGLLTAMMASAADSSPGQVVFETPPEPIVLTNADAQGSALRSFALPVAAMRGAVVTVAADVKAENVSAKPQPWNGIKLMIKVDAPAGTTWPQAEVPVGTFPWRHYATRVTIPAEATAATLIVGLERVSGAVEFGQVRVVLTRVWQPAPPAPPTQPIFRGHVVPRLRGAMVSPRLSEADLAVLADQWHANLIRWQLIRSNPEAAADPGAAGYDRWLAGMLAKTDQVLGWAKRHGVMVVIDLHSPPGGRPSAGGYVAAMGAFFTDPAAQQHFVEVWRTMTRRFKGNPVIWGFDLVNEPVDDQTGERCQDWQGLALAAGRAVRAIDPARTLIVEPPQWGSAAGWRGFNPLPLPRIVYSFHMYEPGRFTHQRVFDQHQTPVAYPGDIEGQRWDRARLLQAMQPAIDFARRYRVRMYVGEFSAIRWAPGAERYLADLTRIFEDQGWDWSYHAFREWEGWSLEYDTDENHQHPSPQPTARFAVLEHWWGLNQPATTP